MSTLDSWIADTEAALNLQAGSIPLDLRNELLDLTREVAHGVARVAGPLTCYLVGQAVARGVSPAEALAAVRQNLPDIPPATGD